MFLYQRRAIATVPSRYTTLFINPFKNNNRCIKTTTNRTTTDITQQQLQRRFLSKKNSASSLSFLKKKTSNSRTNSNSKSKLATTTTATTKVQSTGSSKHKTKILNNTSNNNGNSGPNNNTTRKHYNNDNNNNNRNDSTKRTGSINNNKNNNFNGSSTLIFNTKIVNATNYNEILDIIMEQYHNNPLDNNGTTKKTNIVVSKNSIDCAILVNDDALLLSLNDVCYATCINRITRHLLSSLATTNNLNQPKDMLINDERFLLYFASLATAIVSRTTATTKTTSSSIPIIQFGSRQLTSIVWSITKLQLSVTLPTPTIQQQQQAQQQQEQQQIQSLKNNKLQLLNLANEIINIVIQLRQTIDSNSKNNNINDINSNVNENNAVVSNDNNEQSHNNIIMNTKHELVQVLSSLLLDYIGLVVVTDIQQQQEQQETQQHNSAAAIPTTGSIGMNNNRLHRSSNKNNGSFIDIQACSNLLWSLTSTGRITFIHLESIIAQILCQQQQHQQHNSTTSTTGTEYTKEQLHPQNWSNVLWSIANSNIALGMYQIQFIETIAALMNNDRSFVKRHNTQDLSITAMSIGKIVSTKSISSSSSCITDEIVQNSQDMSTLEARIQQSAITIVLVVAKEVIERNANGFNDQELCNTAWAFATISSACSTNNDDIKLLLIDAMNVILEKSIPNMNEFQKLQGICNLIWSASQLYESDNISSTSETLIHKLLNSVKQRFIGTNGKRNITNSSSNPQDISMILVGFAKLQYKDDRLYKQIIKGISSSNISTFTAQNITNIVWALATAGIVVVPKYQPRKSIITASSVDDSTSTTATTHRQNLKVQKEDDDNDTIVLQFCTILIQEFINRLNEFNCQEITNLCWSLATLCVKDVKFLQAVENEILSRITQETVESTTSFDGQGISSIMWSYATLNHTMSPLLQQSLLPYIQQKCRLKNQNEQLKNRISSVFNRVDLTNMAWACAVFNFFPNDLMNMIYIGQFGSSGLSLDATANNMTPIDRNDSLSLESCMALVQVQVAMDVAHTTYGLSLPCNFPDGFVTTNIGDRVNTSIFTLNLTSSILQKAVSKRLKQIGFDHVVEHRISMKNVADICSLNVPTKDIEVMSIDIANLKSKIAIEVDGPWHFVLDIDTGSVRRQMEKDKQSVQDEYLFQHVPNASTPFYNYEPNGATMLKRRLLKAMGWNVLVVPYWEWDKLQSDCYQEEKYCRNLLATCINK